MVVTKQQVLDLLNTFETDYDMASELGIEALPHLESIVKEADPVLAPKATYLASLIQDEQSVFILMIAARSKLPEVRIAAANGSRNLATDSVNDLLDLLTKDQDYAVRKKAQKSWEMIRTNKIPGN